MMEDARGYIWQNDRIAGADDRIRRLEEGPDWEGRALCSLEIVRSHGENFAGPRHRRHEPDARERTPFARGQSLFDSRAQCFEPGHNVADRAGALDLAAPVYALNDFGTRSEERRVGKEIVRTCISRLARDHYKK